MISLIKYFEEGALGNAALGIGAAGLYTVGALTQGDADKLPKFRNLIKPNVDNIPTKSMTQMTPGEIAGEKRIDAREEAAERRIYKQSDQLKSQGRTSGKFVGGKLQPKGYDDSNLTFQQKIERAAKNQRSNVG